MVCVYIGDDTHRHTQTHTHTHRQTHTHITWFYSNKDKYKGLNMKDMLKGFEYPINILILLISINIYIYIMLQIIIIIFNIVCFNFGLSRLFYKYFNSYTYIYLQYV